MQWNWVIKGRKIPGFSRLGTSRPHRRCLGSPGKLPRRKDGFGVLSNLENSKDQPLEKMQWIGREKSLELFLRSDSTYTSQQQKSAKLRDMRITMAFCYNPSNRLQMFHLFSCFEPHLDKKHRDSTKGVEEMFDAPLHTNVISDDNFWVISKHKIELLDEVIEDLSIIVRFWDREWIRLFAPEKRILKSPRLSGDYKGSHTASTWHPCWSRWTWKGRWGYETSESQIFECRSTGPKSGVLQKERRGHMWLWRGQCPNLYWVFSKPYDKIEKNGIDQSWDGVQQPQQPVLLEWEYLHVYLLRQAMFSSTPCSVWIFGWVESTRKRGGSLNGYVR